MEMTADIHMNTLMATTESPILYAGMGWAGLGWAGLGWAGLGWAGLG